MKACVEIILAPFTFPSASRMLPITDAPMPNISPIPVHTRKRGATMLIAASASLPTRCPTNMPSHILSAELKSIPTRVGKNIAVKSFPILPFPKSSLSLCIIVYLYSVSSLQR